MGGKGGGCGTSFHVLVVSPDFEGMRDIQRKRLIHSALKEEMKTQIHFLRAGTVTPAEYQSKLKDGLEDIHII